MTKIYPVNPLKAWECQIFVNSGTEDKEMKFKNSDRILLLFMSEYFCHFISHKFHGDYNFILVLTLSST